MQITALCDGHADAVLTIYQAGIDEGDATFETTVPSWAEFTSKRLAAHRFVAVGAGEVLGWATVSAVSNRPVYAGVVEDSVYVAPSTRGVGVGRALLEALIDSTEAAGIWTIEAGIFPQNAPSIALHLATGFRIVGTRERIARHRGRWRDVTLLERRSPRV